MHPAKRSFRLADERRIAVLGVLGIILLLLGMGEDDQDFHGDLLSGAGARVWQNQGWTIK